MQKAFARFLLLAFVAVGCGDSDEGGGGSGGGEPGEESVDPDQVSLRGCRKTNLMPAPTSSSRF